MSIGTNIKLELELGKLYAPNIQIRNFIQDVFQIPARNV